VPRTLVESVENLIAKKLLNLLLPQAFHAVQPVAHGIFAETGEGPTDQHQPHDPAFATAHRQIERLPRRRKIEEPIIKRDRLLPVQGQRLIVENQQTLFLQGERQCPARKTQHPDINGQGPRQRRKKGETGGGPVDQMEVVECKEEGAGKKNREVGGEQFGGPFGIPRGQFPLVDHGLEQRGAKLCRRPPQGFQQRGAEKERIAIFFPHLVPEEGGATFPEEFPRQSGLTLPGLAQDQKDSPTAHLGLTQYVDDPGAGKMALRVEHGRAELVGRERSRRWLLLGQGGPLSARGE
jgi:hypothetical protein